MSDLPPASGLVRQITPSTLLPGLLLLYAAYWVLSTVYSAFLGPLSKFPGPRLRAISVLPRLITTVKGNDAEVHAALHRKYGPVVRVAPTGLSFAGGAEHWKAISGFKKPHEPHTYKDPAFFMKPLNGVDSIISADDALHARQRRLVSHAFADKTLKELEPMLKQWCGTLIRVLAEKTKGGKAVDMLKYYNCTTFDIMADLSFNESLHMLEDGEYSRWVTSIFGSIKEASAIRAIRMSHPIVNYLVGKLLQSSPKMRAQLVEHTNYTKERVNRRLQITPERTDLWTKILAASSKGDGLSLKEQHSMAALFMVAGTETTATALSGVTYYLTQNPQYLAKLVDEIRSTHSSFDDLTLESLARLKYLQAILQEGLRMYPPVPTHLPRRVPKGGMEICGDYVPEDTFVAIHQWSTHRNPDLWHLPEEFRPERWLGDPAFANDCRDALEPFSVGPRNCLGKNLAWHEMRLILASILVSFDVELLEESKGWVESQKIFTLWEKIPLMCKIKSVHSSA